MPAPESPAPAATNRRAHPGDLLAALLLVLWGAGMCARIHYGVDLTDEGMYLATSDRLLHGDIPFRDDRENPLRQFDVLNAALFSPFGQMSLVGVRLLGAGFCLGQMVALWAVVRRFFSPWVAALTAGLIPVLPLYGIWTPGYNEWSCACTVFAGAALALAGGATAARGAMRWGAVAGVALGIDGLVYAPALALAVVPLAMIAVGRATGSWRHPWVCAGAATLAIAALVLALDASWIILRGLGPAWSAATADMVHQQGGAVPFGARLEIAWQYLGDVPLHLAITTAVLSALRWLGPVRRFSRFSGVIVTAAIVAILACNLSPAWDDYRHLHEDGSGPPSWHGDGFWILWVWYAELVIGLAGVIVFILPAACRDMIRGKCDGSAALVPAFAIFLLFTGITATASSLGAINGLLIRAAIAVLGLAGIAGFIQQMRSTDGSPEKPRPLSLSPILPALIGQLVFTAVIALAGWQLLFKQPPPSTCTATFAFAPLTGIHGTPAQITELTTLRTWVDAHEAPDAKVIAYHDIPGMAYVLARRPALDWTWTMPNWSWDISNNSTDFCARLVARFEAAGANADFCVRDDHVGAWPVAMRLNDPLHAYVTGHFRLAWRHWPYDVLVPRDAAHPPAEPPVIADALDPTVTGGREAHLLLPVGTTSARDADGDLVLTADPAAPSPIFAVLVDHGDDLVALRLRIESQSPGFTVALMRGNGFGALAGATDRTCPGWDVTFPAGQIIDRGFALVRAPGAATPATRFAFHRLALEAFPDQP
jgi:hypothetical protein